MRLETKQSFMKKFMVLLAIVLIMGGCAGLERKAESPEFQAANKPIRTIRLFVYTDGRNDSTKIKEVIAKSSEMMEKWVGIRLEVIQFQEKQFKNLQEIFVLTQDDREKFDVVMNFARIPIKDRIATEIGMAIVSGMASGVGGLLGGLGTRDAFIDDAYHRYFWSATVDKKHVVWGLLDAIFFSPQKVIPKSRLDLIPVDIFDAGRNIWSDNNLRERVLNNKWRDFNNNRQIPESLRVDSPTPRGVHQTSKPQPPQVVAVPPQKDDSSQKPGAEKLKMEKHAAASSTSLSREETASSEKDKSSISDKTKTSLKQNMPQEKCDAPIWNVGDSWKFASKEIKVIRVEENLYIAEDSSSSDLIAYDKNTLEKTFSIDDKGRKVKIESSLPLFFDFPLYVGKKWKRRFSARPSSATRDYDYLIEYKVLCNEDITVFAGTLNAFKIEITRTNYDAKMVSGKAYIWYSPEVKGFIRAVFDGASYWRGAQGYELMSFNLKDKGISPQEAKLPPEKADIPFQVQPPPVEKKEIPVPFTPSPSPDIKKADIPSKTQLPETHKQQVSTPTAREEKCDTPIWNVGDFWRYRYSDMKEWQFTVERIEKDSYIVDDYYGGYKNCYDKKSLRLVARIDPMGKKQLVYSPWFIDFPIYVGKKWKKVFTSPPAAGVSIDVNYLHEFKVISYEDVTAPAGTFKAFMIEMKSTNYSGQFASGKAYFWYSPEVKYIIKVQYENIPYWSAHRSYALIKFELKDKEIAPQELKLPPQKVDIPPQVQPPPVEKKEIPVPVTHSPSPDIKKADIPSKTQLPETHKQQTAAPGTPPSSTDSIVVTGTSANIRAGAGNEFPIINTVKQGDKLILLGEYGQWLNVRLENGQEGWINSRFAKE